MENVIDLVLQAGTLLGGMGLGAALLPYLRNRRKDSMDAYSDLYEKVRESCDRCEQENKELRERIRGMEAEISQLRAVLPAEVREDAQKFRALGKLIAKDKE